MKIQEREFEKLESIRECYYELIMAVENKYPGETRHQTALRLIKESQAFASLSTAESFCKCEGDTVKSVSKHGVICCKCGNTCSDDGE